MIEEHYVIFTQDDCPWCHKAIDLCKKYNLDYEEYNITGDPVKRAYMKKEGLKTVPQIWLGPMHIGGYTDLRGFLGEGNGEAPKSDRPKINVRDWVNAT